MRTASTSRRSVMARLKARMALFRRRNPCLCAGRYVGAAVTEVLLGVLGVGFIFGLLLPAFDWSWLPHIEIDLSWIGITLPEWLHWPAWLNFTLPDWLKTILAWLKWAAPLAIAIVLTLGELSRRTAKRQGRQRGDE